MERTYRLRHERHPAKEKQHPIEKPSELHKRIFRWLDPFYQFKYLDLRWLAYLEPGETVKPHPRQVYLSQQCGFLFQDPNFYLDRHPDQNYSVAKFRRPSVYNLDKKGMKHLGYPYREAYHRSQSYPHEFMVDMGFYAPLLAAVLEDPAFDLIDTWQLINEHPLFPEKTKKDDKPFNFNIDGDTVKLDGRPVVLRRTKEKVTEAICIPGIQMELCTKQVKESSDANKASVGKHLRHVLALQEKGAEGTSQFEARYGFDRVIIPFIFASKDGIEVAEARMRSSMEFMRNELKATNRSIVFKAMEYYPQADHYPRPGPQPFLSPWVTANGKEFGFDDTAFFR